VSRPVRLPEAMPSRSTQQRVVLVRHGETEWSRSHRHTGRTDVPLTEAGREQALAAGRALAGARFELVLTSPLTRALDTCRLAGLGERAVVVADLAEWDYGAAEGRSTAQIQEETPGWTVWTHPVGGSGETVEAVGERADRVIERIAAAGGDVAVFAHGHLLRILTARWLGMDAAGGRHFVLGTATISVLGYEHGNRVVEVWNDDTHLTGRGVDLAGT
jgi:broad specificity phosphatase PhoE